MNFANPQLNPILREKLLQEWDDTYPNSTGQGVSGMLVFRDGILLLERSGRPVVEHLNIQNCKIVLGQTEVANLNLVLKSGDWVECFGTISGDHFFAEKIVLLSPNLNSDGHGSRVNELSRKWHKFVEDVHMFYRSRGFESIQTPTLVVCPGTEPFIDSFKTEFISGSRRSEFFLPTSPEFHLKKCLSYGYDSIFEIRPCFRNGEISDLHQPEFMMLEWYRAFSSMQQIKNDVRDLVTHFRRELEDVVWHEMSVADLFKAHLDFEIRPTTSMDELRSLASKVGVDVDAAEDFDDVFFFLFLEKIEPQLQNYGQLFLHSYPPSQAALSRLTAEGWGDRFEFYYNGIEIANAFNELNNPKVQRQRSLEDFAKKEKLGKSAIGWDEEFYRCLEAGMPPSCGIALGLDRLFMVLHNLSTINEFRLFPLR